MGYEVPVAGYCARYFPLVERRYPVEVGYKIFHVGETPVFPVDEVNNYHGVAFKRWEPAITPVASTDPVDYTAVYGNPTLTVTDSATGETHTETLKYDYIDEDLLLSNFTKDFKDIGSIQAMSVADCAFVNRRDFWYVQQSDSATVHTINTNLTLEAISFKFRKRALIHICLLKTPKSCTVAMKFR